MQLKLFLPTRGNNFPGFDEGLTISNEGDIRTAGFAAARAVRDWLRNMPFVPSPGDLLLSLSAAVVPDEKPKPAPAPARAAHGDARRATVATQREVPPDVRSSGRAKRKSKRGK